MPGRGGAGGLRALSLAQFREKTRKIVWLRPVEFALQSRGDLLRRLVRAIHFTDALLESKILVPNLQHLRLCDHRAVPRNRQIEIHLEDLVHRSSPIDPTAA